jgi:hypothetical protein
VTDSESRDWFTPYLPVPETAVEEDGFNETLRVEYPEEQQ